jgi:hypothetical protein
MKSSEIARYWAAKELTRIERNGNALTLRAPLAGPRFTLRIPGMAAGDLKLAGNGAPLMLREIPHVRDLAPGTWFREKGGVLACFDLPKGQVSLSQPLEGEQKGRS